LYIEFSKQLNNKNILNRSRDSENDNENKSFLIRKVNVIILWYNIGEI